MVSYYAMGEEKSKNIKTLLGRLAILPVIITLRRGNLDVLNVLLAGGWVLWLIFDAILTVDWTHPLAKKITKSATLRYGVVAVVVLITGWYAHAVHRPALTDPEATENKYVHKRWISPPDDKEFVRAFLVEFGVDRLNSVGVAVGIEFNGDDFDFWMGEPNRTDKQQQRLPIGWDRSELHTGEVLWLNHPDFQITPQRSLYVCVLSNEQEMEEPNDIMYFAVQLNEAKGQPTKTQIGHQYRLKK